MSPPLSGVRRLGRWGRARGRFSAVAAELCRSLRARSPPSPLSVYAEREMPPPSGYTTHTPAPRTVSAQPLSSQTGDLQINKPGLLLGGGG